MDAAATVAAVNKLFSKGAAINLVKPPAEPVAAAISRSTVAARPPDCALVLHGQAADTIAAPDRYMLENQRSAIWKHFFCSRSDEGTQPRSLAPVR